MIYPGLSMLLRKCTFTKTSYFSRIMLIFDVHIVKNTKQNIENIKNEIGTSGWRGSIRLVDRVCLVSGAN